MALELINVPGHTSGSANKAGFGMETGCIFVRVGARKVTCHNDYLIFYADRSSENERLEAGYDQESGQGWDDWMDGRMKPAASRTQHTTTYDLAEMQHVRGGKSKLSSCARQRCSSLARYYKCHEMNKDKRKNNLLPRCQNSFPSASLPRALSRATTALLGPAMTAAAVTQFYQHTRTCQPIQRHLGPAFCAFT